MLSKEERRDLLAMGRSRQLREDCDQLRTARAARPVDLDAYVRFLTTMSRLMTPLPPRRPFVRYPRVLL